MDGSLFACVEWFPVVHAASLHGFMSVKMSQKKEQERKGARKNDTWMG